MVSSAEYGGEASVIRGSEDPDWILNFPHGDPSKVLVLLESNTLLPALQTLEQSGRALSLHLSPSNPFLPSANEGKPEIRSPAPL